MDNEVKQLYGNLDWLWAYYHKQKLPNNHYMINVDGVAVGFNHNNEVVERAIFDHKTITGHYSSTEIGWYNKKTREGVPVYIWRYATLQDIPEGKYTILKYISDGKEEKILETNSWSDILPWSAKLYNGSSLSDFYLNNH